MKRVLVVGGREALRIKARELGAHVSFASVDSVRDGRVEGLRADGAFDLVIAQSETGLLEAAVLADRWGAAGTSLEVARRLADKWTTRCAAAGLPGAVPASLGRSAEDALRFRDTVGGSIVLKPRQGTGSACVARAESHDDIVDAVQTLRAGGWHEFILEAFLEGPEVSVESFSDGGRHVMLAVVSKSTNADFVEIGHAVPATLEPRVLRAIEECLFGFLDAVGLRDGPAHTEMILTDAGPRIVESHPRRGGDRINELVAIATGLDIERLVFGVALGVLRPPAETPPATRAAAIRFLSGRNGTVRSIDGVSDARLMHGVVDLELSVRVGDSVARPRSSTDRLGWIITEADSSSEAARRARNAADAIRIAIA